MFSLFFRTRCSTLSTDLLNSGVLDGHVCCGGWTERVTLMVSGPDSSRLSFCSDVFLFLQHRCIHISVLIAFNPFQSPPHPHWSFLCEPPPPPPVQPSFQDIRSTVITRWLQVCIFHFFLLLLTLLMFIPRQTRDWYSLDNVLDEARLTQEHGSPQQVQRTTQESDLGFKPIKKWKTHNPKRLAMWGEWCWLVSLLMFHQAVTAWFCSRRYLSICLDRNF